MWSLGTSVGIVAIVDVVEGMDFPGLFVNTTLRLWLGVKGGTLRERLLVDENDWGVACLEIAVSSSFWLLLLSSRSSPEETEEALLDNGTTLAVAFFRVDMLCCGRDLRNNVNYMKARKK